MKIVMNGQFKEAILISKHEKEFRSKDGNQGKYYNVGLRLDGEIIEFGCTKEVYDRCVALGDFVRVALIFEFDTNYQKLKVVFLDPVKQVFTPLMLSDRGGCPGWLANFSERFLEV